MLGGKKSFIQESRARFERWWLTADRNKKYPLECAIGRIRIERTLSIIPQNPIASVIDIGSGDAALARRLDQLGHSVFCIDVASQALKEAGSLESNRSCFPYLDAIESQFSLVVCTDLIAELPTTLHRLGLSTLAALVEPKGRVIISTPLDTVSYDALDLFLSLVLTEFEIEKITTSHHRFFLWLLQKLKASQKRLKALNNPEYRLRKGYSLWSLRLLSPLYKLSARPLSWLAHSLEKSERALFLLEKTTQWMQPQRGVSHVICLCRRRKLF